MCVFVTVLKNNRQDLVSQIMRLTYARFMSHFNWNEYLPSFASEVAEVSLLLPVANESAVTVLSTILVVCTVNHFDLLVEYFK